MNQFAEFEAVEVAELTAIEGGFITGRVVIVGCTTPVPPLKPGQVTWNPWIGQPYPTEF